MKYRRKQTITPYLAIVGLGASLGSTAEKIRKLAEATQLLSHNDEEPITSACYLTRPEGGIAQNIFANAAIATRSSLSPSDLMKHLLRLETKLGRTRTSRDPKGGDRVIDLDLLMIYWTHPHPKVVSITTTDLVVPHQQLTSRPFMWWPMMEVMDKLMVKGGTQPLEGLEPLISEAKQNGLYSNKYSNKCSHKLWYQEKLSTDWHTCWHPP